MANNIPAYDYIIPPVPTPSLSTAQMLQSGLSSTPGAHGAPSANAPAPDLRFVPLGTPKLNFLGYYSVPNVPAYAAVPSNQGTTPTVAQDDRLAPYSKTTQPAVPTAYLGSHTASNLTYTSRAQTSSGSTASVHALTPTNPVSHPPPTAQPRASASVPLSTAAFSYSAHRHSRACWDVETSTSICGHRSLSSKIDCADSVQRLNLIAAARADAIRVVTESFTREYPRYEIEMIGWRLEGNATLFSVPDIHQAQDYYYHSLKNGILLLGGIAYMLVVSSRSRKSNLCFHCYGFHHIADCDVKEAHEDPYCGRCTHRHDINHCDGSMKACINYCRRNEVMIYKLTQQLPPLPTNPYTTTLKSVKNPESHSYYSFPVVYMASNGNSIVVFLQRKKPHKEKRKEVDNRRCCYSPYCMETPTLRDTHSAYEHGNITTNG
ncbi:hypothetical protein BDV96DRAFT_662564 [Lophiotrema nucula]|uniref:Uncharacterized protein n=1 Tax=Lophiotrema nucula TaxID=690887 RepID=A0A6A5ZPV3_9PLEO|nr:hypothetical protein BDV96DRAFT_662564 [Lophiotrema nucula]